MPSSPEQRTENANANPSFRTSRYESAAPAGLPQTGQFPLKGRNSSVSLHGRRSETYNRGQGTGEIEPSPRPSSSSPYYGSLPAPRVTSASYGHAASGYSSADGPAKYGSESSSQRKQNPPPTAPPTQEFSNLNLRSPRDRVDQLEQEDFPLRQHRGQEGYALDAQETSFPPTRQDRRAYGEDSSPGIRMVGRARPTQPDERMPAQTTNAIGRDQEDYGYRDRSYDNPRTQATDYGVGYGAEDESVMRRRRSIPRKEVPDVTQTSSATYQTPGSFANPTDRTHRTLKSSSAPRYQYDDDHRSRAQEAAQTYPNVLGRSQRYTQDAPPSAQEVVDRARGNTYDTEVIEKIAPGNSNLFSCVSVCCR